MNSIKKLYVKTFLLAGGVFAGGMAGFDYLLGIKFIFWKLILYIFLFGGFFSWSVVREHKKRVEKNQEKEG